MNLARSHGIQTVSYDRIRIRDPVLFWPLDPGPIPVWKNQKPGSGKNTPDQNSESVGTILPSVPDPYVFGPTDPDLFVWLRLRIHILPSTNKKNVENLWFLNVSDFLIICYLWRLMYSTSTYRRYYASKKSIKIFLLLPSSKFLTKRAGTWSGTRVGSRSVLCCWSGFGIQWLFWPLIWDHAWKNSNTG
jgi:hypothetical protein